jgi:hypothetical protein
MDQKWARLWFGATAVLVLVGLVIQFPVSYNNEGFFFEGSAAAWNVLSFFTIQSNIIVGITCAMLAVRLDWSSTVFKVFRLIGIVGITITGIVFHVAISSLLDLDTWGQAANQIQHTAVPIVAVLGWLMFGPRGLTSPSIVRWSLLFPALYMVFSAIRGEIVGFYPYHFADVGDLGYVRVIINAIWIVLLYFGVGWGAHVLDGFLARREAENVRSTAGRASAPSDR